MAARNTWVDLRVFREDCWEAGLPGARSIRHLAGRSHSVFESFRSNGQEARSGGRYTVHALGIGADEGRAAGLRTECKLRKNYGSGGEICGSRRLSARLDSSDEIQNCANPGLGLSILGIQQILAGDSP